jgi:hypothetical protein
LLVYGVLVVWLTANWMHFVVAGPASKLSDAKSDEDEL